MADITKIYEWDYPVSPDDEVFLLELIRRLEGTLGSWLSIDDCLALINLFECYDFKWDDGFVSDRDFFCNVSNFARVASCFSRDSRMGWHAFYIEYLSEKSSARMWRRADELKERLLSNRHLSFVGAAGG